MQEYVTCPDERPLVMNIRGPARAFRNGTSARALLLLGSMAGFALELAGCPPLPPPLPPPTYAVSGGDYMYIGDWLTVHDVKPLPDNEALLTFENLGTKGTRSATVSVTPGATVGFALDASVLPDLPSNTEDLENYEVDTLKGGAGTEFTLVQDRQAKLPPGAPPNNVYQTYVIDSTLSGATGDDNVIAVPGDVMTWVTKSLPSMVFLIRTPEQYLTTATAT